MPNHQWRKLSIAADGNATMTFTGEVGRLRAVQGDNSQSSTPTPLSKVMARNIKFIVIGCISAISLLVIGFLAGVPALQPGVLVFVKNSDPTPIVNVRVLIGGKALDLGTITPGRTARGLVNPAADSDVLIWYVDAGGVQQSVRVDTYVTGGYRSQQFVRLKILWALD